MCNFFDPDEGRDHRGDGQFFVGLGFVFMLYVLVAGTIFLAITKTDLGTRLVQFTEALL